MNVKETFPSQEKLRRTRRGASPAKTWNKAPTFDQIVEKLSTVFDKQVKPNNNAEMKRYLFKATANKFGYLCLKTSDYQLDRCKSYDDFQNLVNKLEASIIWKTSFPSLLEHISAHCTSPNYVTYVRNLKVN